MASSEQQIAINDEIRLIRFRDVRRLTGLSRYQINALERDGAFPARYTAGERLLGWRLGDVMDWIKTLSVERQRESKLERKKQNGREREDRGRQKNRR
jgi:predicted DNA-binding transcriptional regulator AlpA